LKQIDVGIVHGGYAVSPPHGGVWIETNIYTKSRKNRLSPPHGGVWIETLASQVDRLGYSGHPLTGGCGLKLVWGRVFC